MITSGGLAALACYTVDSDSDAEEEDEEKKVDFGDLFIKEEPAWSLDTDGSSVKIPRDNRSYKYNLYTNNLYNPLKALFSNKK